MAAEEGSAQRFTVTTLFSGTVRVRLNSPRSQSVVSIVPCCHLICCSTLPSIQAPSGENHEIRMPVMSQMFLASLDHFLPLSLQASEKQAHRFFQNLRSKAKFSKYAAQACALKQPRERTDMPEWDTCSGRRGWALP